MNHMEKLAADAMRLLRSDSVSESDKRAIGTAFHALSTAEHELNDILVNVSNTNFVKGELA